MASILVTGNRDHGASEVTLTTRQQEALHEMDEFPKTFRVRQHFEGPELADAAGAVEAELAGLSLRDRVEPGQTVAITAGSRGIANIGPILQAAVRHFRQLGANPFIVPAMGSHGGGTARGQRKILESYGITEDFCGCPIRSSMETVVVCRAAEGFPVHFDKQAYRADHVVVCNRVKPHTLFTGEVESGLMKMMLIGLGKHDGARVYHRAIKDFSFGQIVGSVAREVLSKCSVLAGLAVVENSYGRTAAIQALRPEALL
ncbi:MAG: lactate racemase domain-containing protein, partial [Acidobacteria bacterium]|nr:lactate racemase domain-containing protein [Acidobacteriota bacterium]